MYPEVVLDADVVTPAPEGGSRPIIGTLARIGSAVISNPKGLLGFLILAGFTAVAVFAPWIAPYDPNAPAFAPTAPPSHAHLLGTTTLGQDIFSQLIWGARETLLIGAIAGGIATMVAVIVGVSAAYLGGMADNVLSTFIDIFLVIPALPLMIVIASYAQGGGMWVLIGVIAATGWSYGARQLRPQALSLRHRDFLEAARVRGENSAYIILFEVLPNMISLIVAIFLGSALFAILAAAGLQFIGLGSSSDVSWGTMLYWGETNEAMFTDEPWWIIAPGACIAILGGGLALFNYAIDEFANPALRGKRRKRGKRSATA